MTAPVTDYRICRRCVMDTTDPEIAFDQEGVCHHCRRYDVRVRSSVLPGEAGSRALTQLAERIRAEGRDRRYDCVIGVSGGVDSTYVAYLARSLGLRPLAVHLDNGWDSETAATNIGRALKALSIDLSTYVIDWEEFRDLQLSFLKASTPDAEIPTDHAIFALMYGTADRMGIRHVLTGFNVRTESHMTDAWSRGYYDWRYIRSIHRRFGTVALRSYPHMSLWTYRRYLRKLRSIDVLDFGDYVKADAVRTLERELGWKYYGGKHFESIYTRFFQGYILPRKWGFDKRRSHYSSLICSGEMTREEALDELTKPPYPIDQQRADRVYVAKKLGLSETEFEAILALPRRSFWDYPSYGRLYRNRTFLLLRRLLGGGRDNRS
jgi:N-acetyl sugar amidotransferase